MPAWVAPNVASSTVYWSPNSDESWSISPWHENPENSRYDWADSDRLCVPVHVEAVNGNRGVFYGILVSELGGQLVDQPLPGES